MTLDSPTLPAAGRRALPSVADPAGAPAMPSWLRRTGAWLDRQGAVPGWRRNALAFGAGALATPALPPIGLVPLLLPAFAVLARLTARAPTARSAFMAGWWFGLGWFGLSLYWISFALFTDIQRFWWALPLSAAALPSWLAVFPGLAAAGTVWLRRRLGAPGFGLSGLCLLGALLGIGEWLRGWVLTGFPWNLYGQVWTDWTSVAQAAALVGVYGLTQATILAALAPAALLDPAVPRRRALAALALAWLPLLLGGLWGAARLAVAPRENLPEVRMRIVQPDLSMEDKSRDKGAALEVQRALGQAPAAGGLAPTHIIWSETAISWVLSEQPVLRTHLAEALPPGAVLIAGAYGLIDRPDGEQGLTNSLAVLDRTGTLVAEYHKAHLVPFGEYIPLADWLPGWLPLRSIGYGTAGFATGPGPRTLALPGAPAVSPLICYEAIFPWNAVAPGAARPGWLVNITNDGWYGDTAGPHQHFALAQMRALEQGLPLVRAANTGISGVIDPYGRVVSKAEYGLQGVLDSPLPVAIADGTLYSLVGLVPFWLLVAMTSVAGLVPLILRGRR